MTAPATINIASHLVGMAQRQAGTAAILSELTRGAEGKFQYTTCTFAQLNDQSDVIARGLAAIGITRGMRTALCVKPGVDFFAVTFALFKMGAVPVLIDPGIGVKNFGRCLAEAEPEAFIGIPLAHLLRRTLGWARRTVRINVSTGFFGGQSLRDIARRGAMTASTNSLSVLVDSAPDEPAAILFTSGSTGPPKGVVYTHKNFDAQVRALAWEYRIQPGERDLATFPLFGLFGPALGMTTIIPDMDFTRPGHVDPRHIIEPIQQLGITSLFGSPALIDRVGAWGKEHSVTLPSLKRVISAGAPVPAAVIERFTAMLSPGVQVFTPYGATESLPVCSIGSDEILHETRQMADVGRGVCVGRPVGDMDVRVIRISDDAIELWSDDLQVPAGEVGEIVVKGGVTTRAYYGRPEANRLAKISDTSAGSSAFWHRMGDVGYLDHEGRLWFCGRKSQRVCTPEGDMFSMPVEGVFNAHPLVKRTALVGVESNGVMRPVLCVEPNSDTPMGETFNTNLLDQLRELGDKFEHTREIRDFLVHPGFPVDIRHNAKIGREKLAVWAARKLR